MTLADVLDGMFRLFLSHWRTYALALGVIVVPQSFISALLVDRTGMNTGLLEQFSNPAAAEAAFEAGPELWALGGLAGISILAALFITPYLTGVACRIAGEAYEGGAPEPGDVLRSTLSRYGALLGATVLLGLVGITVLAVPLALIIGGIASDAGQFIAIGGFLMVVAVPLMIWLLVRLSLAYPAIVMERVGPVAALKRSWELVGGRWWRVFGTVLLAQIITGIVAQIAAFPFSLPGQLFGGLFAVVFLALGTTLSAIVTTPLVANAQTLLYYDGRIRSEGYDLELLARDVGGNQTDAGQPFG
jgi:hypothetical protein